jgi:hypothetical protein
MRSAAEGNKNEPKLPAISSTAGERQAGIKAAFKFLELLSYNPLAPACLSMRLSSAGTAPQLANAIFHPDEVGMDGWAQTRVRLTLNLSWNFYKIYPRPIKSSQRLDKVGIIM